MVGSLVHLFTWILVLAFFPDDDGDNDDIIGYIWIVYWVAYPVSYITMPGESLCIDH